MRSTFLLAATVCFSQELAQEIFVEIAKQPYTQVAPLIAKMQNEAAHQPPTSSQPSAPPSPAITKPDEMPKQ